MAENDEKTADEKFIEAAQILYPGYDKDPNDYDVLEITGWHYDDD